MGVDVFPKACGVVARCMRFFSLALGVAAAAFVMPSSREVHACGYETFSANGTVTQIAGDRRSISIAHDAIAGYWAVPKTTTFALLPSARLDGISDGDHVRFTFATTDFDDRTFLREIAKADEVPDRRRVTP
jgi:Cu/Ag efflux protein CusF